MVPTNKGRRTTIAGALRTCGAKLGCDPSTNGSAPRDPRILAMVQGATPDAAFRTNTFHNDTCRSHVERGRQFERITNHNIRTVSDSWIIYMAISTVYKPQCFRIFPSRILPYSKLSRIHQNRAYRCTQANSLWWGHVFNWSSRVFNWSSRVFNWSSRVFVVV